MSISRTTRALLVVAGVGLLIAAMGLWVETRTRTAPVDQKYFCWDAPSRGTPAKYIINFDNGVAVETTGECVRVPLDLRPGDHLASVRAVDVNGQSSPPASLKFSVQ